MTGQTNPQPSDSQKELILLWIMMTASSDYDPTKRKAAQNIVNGIRDEMRAALGGGSNWNWPNLTLNNALQFASQAFPASLAGQFSNVIGAFQNGRSAATGAAAPWPPDDGKIHPGVAEIAVNLGLVPSGN